MTTDQYPKVTVVTIMYGDRWKFLSQVISATMKDSHVTKMIIVDNGSVNKEEIENGTKEYGERVVILRQEKNLGSAGGFAVGIEYARSTVCDFVLLLDDDSIPEEGFVDYFMDVYTFLPDKNAVLSGCRFNVLNNKDIFFSQTILNDEPRGTFFEFFSFKKVPKFLELLHVRKKKEIKKAPYTPIIPTEAFVYGGTFLPIEAVRKTVLPDKKLFLYGDDIEYSWNVKKSGYASYMASRPRIYDIDFTFGVGGSYIYGQFEKKLPPFKVYYRLRNMVLLSRRHTRQNKIILFLNIIFWVLGLYFLGFLRYGHTSEYYKRIILMTKAVVAGYFPESAFAKRIENSF